MQIQIKTDLKAYSKGMSEIAKRQLPFAMAQALTETAGHAGIAWQDEMRHVLDRPTPFTVNSVAIRGARKDTLTATVFIKDIAAEYLEPFLTGGPHFLGTKKGLLTPKDISTNAYGNLPKSKLASLKAKANVFIGKVETKDGKVINGVWERTSLNGKGSPRRKGQRGSLFSQQHGRLKLLIRFNDPMPVKQRLDFNTPTINAVRRTFDPAFTKAFTKAMATAR